MGQAILCRFLWLSELIAEGLEHLAVVGRLIQTVGRKQHSDVVKLGRFGIKFKEKFPGENQRGAKLPKRRS